MLNWVSCQDAELTSSSVLMRGMWAAIALDLHRPVTMVAIESLESMWIGVLQSKVLVKHWVVIVEAREVKTSLGREMA